MPGADTCAEHMTVRRDRGTRSHSPKTHRLPKPPWAKYYARKEWFETKRKQLRDSPHCAAHLLMVPPVPENRDAGVPPTPQHVDGEVCDHVFALRLLWGLGGESLVERYVYDRRNIQTLCVPCHGSKTGYEARGLYRDHRVPIDHFIDPRASKDQILRGIEQALSKV